MAALYLLPIGLVAALLATRRVSLLAAGLAGLAATLPAAWVALPAGTDAAAVLAAEAGKGAWLAWHAIAVILAGLFFHHVVQQARPAETASEAGALTPRRLFAVCFLLGPFFEAETGFGVGLVIVVPVLLRAGLAPVRAAVFGLYSQTLVPWGAMAIGSTVGAELAGMTPSALGQGSALATAPLLAGYLAVYWRLAGRAGLAVGRGQRLDDLAWTLALAAGIYAVNRWIALEAGALVACGALMLVRLWRDERPDRARLKALAGQAAPYLALTLLVLATRAVPAIGEPLRDLALLRPVPDLPGFGLAYHVGVLILVVALAHGFSRRLDRAAWARAVAKAGEAAWTPVAVTLAFVVMGRLTGASGMAAAMTEALVAAAGEAAVLASPAMAALAGFLTGSNVAANAILMPLQTQIAAQTGLPLAWIAALQNTAGSNFTLLSPIRVAMGAALIRDRRAAGAIYREALPLGVVAGALLLAMAALVGATG